MPFGLAVNKRKPWARPSTGPGGTTGAPTRNRRRVGGSRTGGIVDRPMKAKLGKPVPLTRYEGEGERRQKQMKKVQRHAQPRNRTRRTLPANMMATPQPAVQPQQQMAQPMPQQPMQPMPQQPQMMQQQYPGAVGGMPQVGQQFQPMPMQPQMMQFPQQQQPMQQFQPQPQQQQGGYYQQQFRQPWSPYGY